MNSPPAYRVDGQPCDRETFYSMACDPARSVAVEACAGAGKTWLLVSRILRALLAGAEPQEILAITFTRKAAAEMRQRLGDWLREFAAASPERRIQELRQRGLSALDAARAQARLGDLPARILAGDRPVEVLTFHGWFWRLMRAAPMTVLEAMGLHAGMSLLEDSAELEPELMRRFQREVDRSAELLADYRTLSLRHGRWKLGQWLNSALKNRVEIERCDAAGLAEESVVDPAALSQCCAAGVAPVQRLITDPALRGLLDATATALGRQKIVAQRKAGDGLRDALLIADGQAAFERAWTALCTTTGSPRKLGDLALVGETIAALETVAQMQRQFTARDDHLRMLRLARVLLTCWRDCKRDHSLADMTDLETCAVALLSDPVVSGWVQERLDARVRHLLIDEFQDTSPLQWHALHHWLSAYAGAGGGASGQRALSLFVVGDPKQSIYRFRRAEPRVFAAACDFVRDAMDGVVLACDHTRRSAPALVDGLNGVFNHACSDGEFAGFRGHTTELGSPAGEIWSLPEVLRGEREAATAAGAGRWRDSLTERRVEPEEVRRMAEARHVAAAIAEMLAPGEIAPRQIMVLARKRSVLLLVEEALRDSHIACVAAQDLRLISLPEVLDLVAVVDLLASPGHDLSLARALKSPLFSADDGDLLALSLRAADQGDHWFAALSDWHDAPPALDRARRLLGRWAGAARELPPHDLLDRIVAEGDALARFVAAAPSEQRDAAAQAISALLWHALSLDEGRYATPYNFVRALRKGLQTATATSHVDAVQLLTVHGAKGLEADVVFIADADAEASTRSEPGVLVDWPVDAARPQVAAFVANLNQPPPSLAELQAEEQDLQARESLNLLYVAMTRARHRLVFSRTEPHRSGAGRSWWNRVEALAEPWLPAPPLPDKSPAQTTLAIPMLPRWRGRPAENTAMKTDAHRDDSREPVPDTELTRRGRALHRALEWATAVSGSPSAGQAIARRALALAAANEFGLGEADSALIEASLSRIIDSAELARFFDPACCIWAANEASVADRGELLRLDRVVQLKAEFGGEWWVLDYKLGSTADSAPANQRQLSRYRRLVAALQPGQIVRAAWITSEGRLIEWLG